MFLTRNPKASPRPSDSTISDNLDIEGEVIHALDAEGRRLFIGHFQQLVEAAMPGAVAGSPKAIFEYEKSLRLPAMSLKEIYMTLPDVPAYAALCERLGLSPRDCQQLAQMEISRKQWAQALEWVEKGLALKPKRNWHNEAACGLEQLKPEILRHLGRKEDALALAWGDFEEHPSDFAYEQLMRYVPKGKKAVWHERVMAAAEKAGLGEFIVNAGKSKYYREALDHFENARDLYHAAGHAAEWQSLARTVRVAHSRKQGFLSAFERIVSGKSHSSSYAEEAQARWRRLTS